jgi:hypothetical protein
LHLILLFSLLAVETRAQYSSRIDATSLEMVKEALQYIYNLEYEKAEPIINALEGRIGEHPGFPLLQAVYTNWKDRPLKEGTKGYENFGLYLNRTLEMSEEILEQDEGDVEGIFFSLAAYGFLAQMHADAGNNMKALSAAKNAYHYIKMGFDLADEYPEFYFPGGIYNYYRVRYPEENPFYKSFMWVFKDGDKALGLQMLKTGVEQSVFTKAECLTYLCHIYLRYEDVPAVSLQYAEQLRMLYPQNLNFIALTAEGLIRMQKYTEIMTYIQQLRESDNKYYQYIGEIFYGIYLEQSLKDMSGATAAFNRAQDISESKDVNILHYDSMLLLGMGRINQKMGNESTARGYFKLAAKYAEYGIVREEAKAYLE